MPRVLVLDGETNPAVAAVRSLSRSGYYVEAGAAARWSKAGLSRYCRASFTYANPESEPQQFIADLVERIAKQPGTIIMPMTDRATLAVSLHREQIAKARGIVTLAPHEAILRALDKEYVRNLAQSLGVATPETVVVGSPSQARAISEQIFYPAVLKSRFSEEFCENGRFRTTRPACYATQPDEFLSKYEWLRCGCEIILAQEFIAGISAGYSALVSNGEVRAEFAHIRLRDLNPTGSGSALRLSIQPSAALRYAGSSLLRALGWHGVAMVEFKVRADGTPVLMEVNGRFWGSLALAVEAGVDFPVLAARMAQNETFERPPPYRTGLRCRWIMGDLLHLLRVWRGKPKEYPGAFPKRWRALADFMTAVRGTYHDNFRIDDPLPELGDWLQALRKVTSFSTTADIRNNNGSRPLCAGALGRFEPTKDIRYPSNTRVRFRSYLPQKVGSRWVLSPRKAVLVKDFSRDRSQ
jgi:predicted ATP-grasp superfamily ATP-dependent carboligase